MQETDVDCRKSQYSDAVKLTDGQAVYSASKALAERAAWDFMETEKPHFTLTTIAPTWILGASTDPSLKSLESARSTFQIPIQSVLDKEKVLHNPALTSFVNVRDVALAHVKAVITPSAAEKRYLLVSGRYSNERVAVILRKKFPDHKDRIPEVTEEEAAFPPFYSTDSEPAAKDFGIKYIGLEETITEWGAQALALPKSQ